MIMVNDMISFFSTANWDHGLVFDVQGGHTFIAGHFAFFDGAYRGIFHFHVK